jgi:hypothetical protein
VYQKPTETVEIALSLLGSFHARFFFWCHPATADQVFLCVMCEVIKFALYIETTLNRLKWGKLGLQVVSW